MGFWPTWNRYNAATKRRISTVKCVLEDICTEIIFMKYKEEIQVIHFNSFLKRRDKIHTAIYIANEGDELIDRKRIFKISYKPF